VAASPYQCELEVSVDVTPVGVVIDAALRQGALRDLTIEDPPLDEIIQAFYAGSARRRADGDVLEEAS
jgi:hypothetical protein